MEKNIESKTIKINYLTPHRAATIGFLSQISNKKLKKYLKLQKIHLSEKTLNWLKNFYKHDNQT